MSTQPTKGQKLLLDFIGSIEAPKGYGTVYGNKQSKLSKPLTEWTINEIINAKPTFYARFGSSACGRYQFMKDTLKSLIEEKAVTINELFTPNIQDRLGVVLLERRGYNDFISGKLNIRAFGLKLAQEWASFPVLAAVKGAHRNVSRGESYYAGDKQNKSLVAPTEVENVLREVLKLEGVSQAAEPVKKAPKEKVYAESLLTKEEIKYIQQRLQTLGYHEVGLVDGIWGEKAKAAVELIQARAKELGDSVIVDGHYGPQTKNLIDPIQGNRYQRLVSEDRANASVRFLAKIGNPGVVKGRDIKFASILGVISSVAAAAYAASQAPTDLPPGSSIFLAFMPPGAAAMISAIGPYLITFGVSLYTTYKGQGVVDSSVERFREGIDNSGLPPQMDHDLGGFLSKIFKF